MHVIMEPKPVLALSLNAAWQKTLDFKQVAWNGVNRATASHEAGGGKGVNVARVFRRMQWPVGLAAFTGGHTGDCLKAELAQSGVEDLTIDTVGVTRCCYTVIDREHGTATELIEPSAPVSAAELSRMEELLAQNVHRFGAVAMCGSLPPGVTTDIYVQTARLAQEAGIPSVLDAVADIGCVLETGVTLVKINADELSQLFAEDSIVSSAKALLERYSKVQWLGVTDGGRPGWLFNQKGDCYKVTLPALESIVSPIGGGDCATAIITRRLAERCETWEVAEAFAEALACASASCLTDTPSVFQPEDAMRLLAQTHLDKLSL